MRSKISLVPCESYDIEQVKEAVSHAVEEQGGMAAHLRPGTTVLLKPNLLKSAKPEQCVTTHPAVFEAVAALCLDCGVRVITGDCGGYGTMGDRMGATGLAEVARRLGVQTVSFSDPVRLEPHASNVYRRIEVARQVVEADAIINLPKMKSHCQMLLTGAVKNLFGCILGARKPQWHMKSGGDRVYFGMMLVELFEHLAPAMTVMDGVLAMEGNGPAAGTPRPVGVILAGTDCVAIDTVMAQLLGVDPRTVPVLAAAERLGIGAWSPEQIQLCGGRIEEHKVSDFVLPSLRSLDFMGPRVLKRFIRNTLVPMPQIDPERCTLCNDCVEVCPTDVMSIAHERLQIDYDGCVNCFLCDDVCPEDAIHERTGLLGRMLVRPAS